MIMRNLIGIFILILILPFDSCLYQYCNHTFTVPANNKIYIQSPYYPKKYTEGSSCMYHIRAPIDYVINAVCTISLYSNPGSCSTEYFYVDNEGDTSEDLMGSKYFCGDGVVKQSSLFNRMTVAYESRSTTPGINGIFSCEFSAVPETSCDCGWTVTSKITGGISAGQNEYPSIVKVALPNQLFCGGIIISHTCILTAAHCVYKLAASDIKIITGQHFTKPGAYNKYYGSYSVAIKKVHENYNPQTNKNDIAILVTTYNIEWSRGIGPACLPWLYEAATLVNQFINIVGWGLTQFSGLLPTTLQKATVKVISNTDCGTYYSSIDGNQLCTMSPPKDSCQQDSGGPCYYLQTSRQLLMCIISYGSFCGSQNPSVNTRVTSYLPWIKINSVGAECRKT